jgi:hypothetical protein
MIYRQLLVACVLALEVGASAKPSTKSRLPSPADNWLKAQSSQVKEIRIGTAGWEKPIGLYEAMEGIKISDQKTIRKLLLTLRCSGSLTDGKAKAELERDGHYPRLRIEIWNRRDYNYLTLFKSGKRYYIERSKLTENQGYESKGVASVDPHSVSKFLQMVRLQVFQARRKRDKRSFFFFEGP